AILIGRSLMGWFLVATPVEARQFTTWILSSRRNSKSPATGSGRASGARLLICSITAISSAAAGSLETPLCRLRLLERPSAVSPPSNREGNSSSWFDCVSNEANANENGESRAVHRWRGGCLQGGSLF